MAAFPSIFQTKCLLVPHFSFLPLQFLIELSLFCCEKWLYLKSFPFSLLPYMQHIYSFSKIFNRLSSVLKFSGRNCVVGHGNKRESCRKFCDDISFLFYLLFILCFYIHTSPAIGIYVMTNMLVYIVLFRNVKRFLMYSVQRFVGESSESTRVPMHVYWARICKPSKEPRNRFASWRAWTTIPFVVPDRQNT